MRTEKRSYVIDFPTCGHRVTHFQHILHEANFAQRSIIAKPSAVRFELVLKQKSIGHRDYLI